MLNNFSSYLDTLNQISIIQYKSNKEDDGCHHQKRNTNLRFIISTTKTNQPYITKKNWDDNCRWKHTPSHAPTCFLTDNERCDTVVWPRKKHANAHHQKHHDRQHRHL